MPEKPMPEKPMPGRTIPAMTHLQIQMLFPILATGGPAP